MPAGKSTVSKWDDGHYVTAYVLARAGETDEVIAAALGTVRPHLYTWFKKKPALKDAVDRGRRDRQAPEGLSSHVYGFLPEKLQELWDRIDLCSSLENGHRRVEKLLENEGDSTRQHLFLYALANSGFDPSQACKKLGISLKTLRRWREESTDFVELMDEVNEHKKNFFESHFIELVRQGSESATIHAAKTYIGDRGYKEVKEKKVEHDHRHSGGVKVTYSLDQLELPEEVACGLLDALLAFKEKQKRQPQQVVIDQPPVYGLKQLPAPSDSKDAKGE